MLLELLELEANLLDQNVNELEFELPIQNIDETSQHLVMPSNANQIKIEHDVFPAFVIKMPDGLPRIQLRDLPILDFVSSDLLGTCLGSISE